MYTNHIGCQKRTKLFITASLPASQTYSAHRNGTPIATVPIKPFLVSRSWTFMVNSMIDVCVMVKTTVCAKLKVMLMRKLSARELEREGVGGARVYLVSGRSRVS